MSTTLGAGVNSLRFGNPATTAAITARSSAYLILLGARRGEIGAIAFSEISPDGMWTLPASRSKNKHKHVLPLMPMALEIINSVPHMVSRDQLFGVRGGMASPLGSRSKPANSTHARAWSGGGRYTISGESFSTPPTRPRRCAARRRADFEPPKKATAGRSGRHLQQEEANPTSAKSAPR